MVPEERDLTDFSLKFSKVIFVKIKWSQWKAARDTGGIGHSVSSCCQISAENKSGMVARFCDYNEWKNLLSRVRSLWATDSFRCDFVNLGEDLNTRITYEPLLPYVLYRDGETQNVHHMIFIIHPWADRDIKGELSIMHLVPTAMFITYSIRFSRTSVSQSNAAISQMHSVSTVSFKINRRSCWQRIRYYIIGIPAFNIDP